MNTLNTVTTIISLLFINCHVFAANKLTMEETEVLVKKVKNFITVDPSIKELFKKPIQDAIVRETNEMSKKTPYRLDRMTIVNSIVYADNRVINDYGLELKDFISQGLSKVEIISLLNSNNFKKEMKNKACTIPLSELAISEYNIWYEFNYYDESNNSYMTSVTIKSCN